MEEIISSDEILDAWEANQQYNGYSVAYHLARVVGLACAQASCAETIMPGSTVMGLVNKNSRLQALKCVRKGDTRTTPQLAALDDCIASMEQAEGRRGLACLMGMMGGHPHESSTPACPCSWRYEQATSCVWE
jgi:hypothetical protein